MKFIFLESFLQFRKKNFFIHDNLHGNNHQIIFSFSSLLITWEKNFIFFIRLRTSNQKFLWTFHSIHLHERAKLNQNQEIFLSFSDAKSKGRGTSVNYLIFEKFKDFLELFFLNNLLNSFKKFVQREPELHVLRTF